MEASRGCLAASLRRSACSLRIELELELELELVDIVDVKPVRESKCVRRLVTV